MEVCRPEKRTWKLVRQRLYLWRRFRNQDTAKKRTLTKALRSRLTEMSQAEAHEYHKDPQGCGTDNRWKLVKRNRRERLMALSILADIYVWKQDEIKFAMPAGTTNVVGFMRDKFAERGVNPRDGVVITQMNTDTLEVIVTWRQK